MNLNKEFKCQTCKHSVFDEKWGEYKCKATHRRVYDDPDDCEHYKKAQGKNNSRK